MKKLAREVLLFALLAGVLSVISVSGMLLGGGGIFVFGAPIILVPYALFRMARLAFMAAQ
jgi:hypothetical protein